MAMISYRPRDPRRGGWGTLLDRSESDPSRPQGSADSSPGEPSEADSSWPTSSIDLLLAEFTSRWEEGDEPSLEEYLALLNPPSAADATALIYQAYCLSERSGRNPDPADFIGRFPAYRDSLARLFGLHRAFDSFLLPRSPSSTMLPEVGDEIGPFLLIRQLGEGGFARVFLAEQSDLDRRLVVVKVSTRMTPEPRLLARARHSHIVEVLWHSTIRDAGFQLVCMPFLGGATLSSVLADRERRGERPRSGRDLLAALDRVSAPEYPVAELVRPAREAIARLPYPKAVAWIVARLAEALDFAYGRGVLHGDVKPSNILLTADGVPMLLDFNLAVGCRSQREVLAGDAGGTLAYMAPERLGAVARREDAPAPRAADRHRADIYSLGMVLLEALVGRTPDQHAGSRRGPGELAAALAASRARDVGALVRSSRAALAAPMRAILSRCLAPDPADRYQRASELADDLDRWCRDRPLAFARQPRSQWAVLRRGRRPLIVAAGALMLAGAALGVLSVWMTSERALREKAEAKLAQLWDRSGSRVFRFARYGHWRAEDHDIPEEAFDRLAYYDVLGAEDWRSRDEFCALSEPDRQDLEIWLLEQAFRLGRALLQRPDSPEDWRRGLEVLERVVGFRALGPLETQCRLLRQRLGLPPSAVPKAPAPAADPPPRWMEEYLLGVEAEPRRAGDALAHYNQVLREHPDAFWAHYRAAAVAYRLGDRAAAVEHLELCARLRPENPALRGQLAGCLHDLRRFDAALEQCNRGLALDPEFAELYRTRAFIHNRLGQSEELKKDIRRFELLTRPLGRVPAWRLRMDWLLFDRLDGAGAIDRDPADGDLPRRLLTADPEDVDLRTALAMQLQESGQESLALDECNKVLEVNPDHLRARFLRGALLYKRHRGEADADLSFLLDHPRFEEFLRECRPALKAFYCDSSELLEKGDADGALRVAWNGLAYARRLDDRPTQGKMHYALARAYARGAGAAPEQLERAAAHLLVASGFNRDYLGQRWFYGDRFFDGQRRQILALLPEQPGEPD